jgi:hypothetical protein
MLERNDSARREMHGAGAEGACEMQAGRGRARVLALADACGGGPGREVRTSCGDQAGQGPGGPSREREDGPGHAV